MPEYQLQIKQVVDYPRCRIYREFIHKLINDRSIRINGGSGLFHFTVLCSYANFRTSYRSVVRKIRIIAGFLKLFIIRLVSYWAVRFTRKVV